MKMTWILVFAIFSLPVPAQEGLSRVSLPGAMVRTEIREVPTVFTTDRDGGLYKPVQSDSLAMIKNWENPDDYILTRRQIEQMPYTDIRDIAATLPGVYQARRGDGLHIYGSR